MTDTATTREKEGEPPNRGSDSFSQTGSMADALQAENEQLRQQIQTLTQEKQATLQRVQVCWQ